ncbi:hypothetical protein Tco_0087487 [Tanacetum coccineum]
MDQDHPIRTSSWKPTMPSSNKTQLAADPEKCMSAASTFDRLNVLGNSSNNHFGKMVISEMWKRVIDFEESFASSARLEAVVAGTIIMDSGNQRILALNKTSFSDAIMTDAFILEKSTSGGIQFLEINFYSWMSKKTKLHCICLHAEKQRLAVICELCSSNVDETQLQAYASAQQNYHCIATLSQP